MSARTRLPQHLVPPRPKSSRLKPQFFSAQQLDSLESMLNRTVLTVQRATHRDILELGDRYVSADKSLPAAVEPAPGSGVDVDSLLQQAQAKFDRDLRAARDALRRDLEADKERALAEQKEEFERHLDQVCALRDKAEAMAKRDLRRACELDKQAALRQQRDAMDTLRREAVEQARIEERQLARESSAADRAEAVQRALDEAEVAFQRREEQTIERTRQECRRQFNEELAGIRRRQREEVDSWMTKYKDLYKNFERLLSTSRSVEGDFQSLQTDYRRFLDYSDGHFHSDYMMKLKQVCLDAASDVGRSLVPQSAALSVAEFPRPATAATISSSVAPNRQRVALVQRKKPMKLQSASAAAVSASAPRPLTRHAEVYTDDDVF